MNWQDVLKSLAPTVASAIAGPLGGIAVSALGDALGIDKPTQDKVAKAIGGQTMTPDQLAKLQELELQYQENEKERGFRYADLAFKDRDSARQMQIATHSKMPAVLTIMVTIGFFGILTMLFFNPEMKSNEIVMIMVGQLSTVWAGCVAFYTGTTFSSANKTAALTQAK